MGTNRNGRFFCALLAGLIFSTHSFAANTWFVRAQNSNHVCNPSCDGSSYNNAWKGLNTIVWGSSGVDSGDTLYLAGPVYSNGRFTPPSGLPGAPITISGNAPKVTNPAGPNDYDPGILIGNHAGYTYNQTTWQVEYPDPVNNEPIYKIVVAGQSSPTYTQVMEVDRSQAAFTYKLLTSVTFTGTVPNVPYDQWAPGTVGISYEQPQFKVVIYKPSYPVDDPNHDLAFYTQISEALLIKDKSYINFEDLRVIGLGQRAFILNNADYIRIERCDISGGVDNAAITIYADSDFGIIRDSSIHDAAAGIWLYPAVSGLPDTYSNDDWLITGNEIHDINQFGVFSINDPHGIGIQSGNRLTITRNHIHHILRSGITFYNFSNDTNDQGPGNDQKDNVVAYNIIHDIYDERASCSNYLDANCQTQRAFELGGDSVPVPGTVTGNIAHHNIIYNIGKRALRFKTSAQPEGPGWKLYNNVIHNAGYGLTFLSGFEFRNNIISQSVVRHIYLGQRIENAGSELVDVDLSHNIYYPADGDDFGYEINGGCNPPPCKRTGDLAWWQTATGLDLVGSTTGDPVFVDTAAYDFHLTATSAAIDAATPVGFTTDLDGNNLLGTPDIGPYEFGNQDSDLDGMIDYDELCYDGDCQDYNPYDPVTNPTGGDLDLSNPDTDGDGYRDGSESTLGSDPINATSTPSIVADGDVNLDGQVNVADILLAQRHLFGLTTLTAEQIDYGDYRPAPNGDGQLGIADVLMIIRTALGGP